MAKFGKDNPPPGRRRGSRNKVPKALKDMILQSLSNLGGTDYLEACGRDQRLQSAYLALIGRVLPFQIKEGGADPTVPTTVTHHIYPPK